MDRKRERTDAHFLNKRGKVAQTPHFSPHSTELQMSLCHPVNTAVSVYTNTSVFFIYSVIKIPSLQASHNYAFQRGRHLPFTLPFSITSN